MKKAISLFLVLVVGALVLTGCFGNKNAVTGKEGAMLALASERLNGNFTGGNSLFANAEEDLRDMAKQGEGFVMNIRRASNTRRSMVKAEDIVAADRNNTQFNEAVLRSVDLATRGADSIKTMKERVRVVDTWVEMGDERMLLHVEENSELLLAEYPDANESFVCYRTRDERGVERYELLIEARDTGFTMRAIYIKDMLYEYTESFSHPGSDALNYIGFRAKNIGGTWECMEIRYHAENTEMPFSFRHLVFTDELCFAAGIENLTNEIGAIYISTPDRTADIMLASEGGQGESSYQLYLGTFTGYEGIVFEGEHKGYIVLNNGEEISSYSKINENVSVANLTHYTTAWGTEAELVMHVLGGTAEERRNSLKAVLLDWGLECVVSIDNVFKMISDAEKIANDIHKDATWHDERIDDISACRRALEIESAEFDTLFAYLDEYKNHAVVKESALNASSSLVQFADLQDVDANVSVASDGLSFTVTRAVGTVSDLTLFTTGDEYYLAVALRNDSGIIHLGDYSKIYTINEGSSLSLEIGQNVFDVSSIASGEYEIVVYASTKDGIRSSTASSIGRVVIP